MNYLQVTVTTTTEGSDIVASLLMDEGSEGVSIIDHKDVEDLIKSDVIWDYIDDSLKIDDKKVFVSGFYDEWKNLSSLNQKLDLLKANAAVDVGSLETSVSVNRTEDYENVWKQFYTPIEIGEKLVVVPKWLKHSDNGRNAVYIDPGMAFGTGKHETTSMCLKLLDSTDLQDKTVADMGCGSGILGIAAMKLGAKSCMMNDIDPQAVKAAKENAELNGVDCTILLGDLKNDGEQFDVIIANITADVLIRLSSVIESMAKKGTTVILSGIINERADDVVKAYGKFLLKDRIKDGEWQALRYIV